MIFCLLHESPVIDGAEQDAIDRNENKTAHQGRDPALTLIRNSRNISMNEWGKEILNEIHAVCEILDATCNGEHYCTALQEQMAIVQDASLAPSARILDEMRSSNEGFFEMACRVSEMHRNQLSNSELSQTDVNFFVEVVRQSIEKQQQLEASETKSFDQFLHDYFSDTLADQAITV